jgi:FlaA1/EpsC-like NDP-sugar epimerase
MISVEDSYSTYEYADYYKILPAIHQWSKDPERIKNGVKVAEGFEYVSDTNTEWMDVDALRFLMNGYELQKAA